MVQSPERDMEEKKKPFLSSHTDFHFGQCTSGSVQQTCYKCVPLCEVFSSDFCYVYGNLMCLYLRQILK